jgi:hypothetical protein
VIDVAIHFGRTQARVELERSGSICWVTLWPVTERLEAVTSTTSKVRIFCTTHAAAEVLAEAFVKCGARRVSREVDLKSDF